MSAEQFQEHWNTWQVVLLAVRDRKVKDEDFKETFGKFIDASVEHCIPRGLARPDLVDKVQDVAERCGFIERFGLDDLQAFMGQHIEEAEEHVERVPEDDVALDKDSNGHAGGQQHNWYTEREQEPTFIATPYVFPDPAAIPPRQWLHAGHYVRGAVTATVAPGGFGKTTLTIHEMISMALEEKRIWYISGEDPKVEIDRRIAAHCQLHDVDKTKVAEFLFVDDKQSFPISLGKSPRASFVTFDEVWLKRLVQQVRNNKIDVVALDPFISFHSVPEIDNGAIDQIIKSLSAIAQKANICIEISHHVRKPIQGQQELTVDDSRGGSAIINAVRSARVINRMSSNEAGLAKIMEDKRTSYVRVDKGKRNMAPADAATWWHIVSVFLPNGDNVQAITRWDFPSAFDGMSQNEIVWIQNLLKQGGPKRASSQSAEWLGHDLGRHCNRDTTVKGGAVWANQILAQWERNAVVKKVSLRDHEQRKSFAYYVHPDYSAPVLPLNPGEED
jgi:AAA domain